MEVVAGLDRDALERARLSRDRRFDGRFFIGVTTTGIYCRPVCPAPAPRSAHVRYFPSAAAAAEAGFRPCLRCRPEAAPGTPAWLGTSAVVRRALRLMDEGALDGESVEALAARLGVGARHLHRLFVRHVGAPPIAVAQTRRLQFAKRLLDETSLPITQVALAAGYGSLRRFNTAFRAAYDRAPRELRRPASAAPGNTGDAIVLRLAVRPPYDWALVRDFLAARALPGVERVDAGGYARTIAIPGGTAIVRVRPCERAAALELRVERAPPAALLALSSAARRTFDVAAEPARIAAVFAGDPLLGQLARARPGLRIPGAWDPFECTVRAVLGQQVSVAAARTLAARIVARFGAPLAEPEDGLTHLFPSAQVLADADLTGIGLTRARAATLRALARAVASGALDFHAPAEEAVQTLRGLPGIGDWTAQYVALRALGEPDAFPAGDLVLRRTVGRARRPLTAHALRARAERWRPWRGYAVLHVWRAALARAR